jgi:fatty acid desaturase
VLACERKLEIRDRQSHNRSCGFPTTEPTHRAVAMDPAKYQALDDLQREQLVNAAGLSFRDFRKALRPRYTLVWLHLLCGHLALLAVAVAAIAMDVAYPRLLPVTILVSALLFGYAHAYIQLFFHEAAHFNIASGKRLNDVLANVFIGVLVGQDIRAYRVIHMMHHRELGTTLDSERTYFRALSIRFLVETLTGIQVLRVLSGREALLQSPGEGPSRVTGRVLKIICALLNGAIVLGAAWLGFWSLAIGWTLGFLAVFPFFGAVRQVLEHRDENALSDVDYSRTAHGAINRLFGDGPLASTLGGAGFNRHLIHHWEPQISYTRLREVEGFLMQTAAADDLRRRQTTYLRTFARLFASARGMPARSSNP